MKFESTLARPLLLVIAAAICLMQPLAAQAADASIERHKRDYENRLAALKSIHSALSRHADQPGVGETLGVAETRIREAAEIAAVEEYEIASSILDDGSILLNTALVRLRNVPGASAQAASSAAGADQASADRSIRAHVERDFEYTRSLIHALRREPGVKPEDIVPIERGIEAAKVLLDAGKAGDADRLIDATYANAKALLAKFQKPSSGKTGSAALEAATQSKKAALDTAELRAQFAQRERSVVSLHSACEQLVKEKPQHQPLLTESGKLLAEARQQAKQGQYPKGIATLDRTYLLLKTGIGEMRGGQEVTAAKIFATTADEYRYEQGRNDDYGQLIGGLIERTPRADWSATAASAKGKRSSADAAAEAGDWPAALKQIDESTALLKQILRSAGYPII